MATTDWNPILRGEFAKPYWQQLQQFVAAERSNATVYPPADDVFAALHLTPYADVRVMILGQDPYHGPRQAHGLCFSVRRGVAVPPSLLNIYKELESDPGVVPDHGNLERWARQGVLLLNATLTVRAGKAGSHQGKGWETFTDEVIKVVNAKPEHVVFLLWGSYARKKKALDRYPPAHGDRVAPPVAAVRPQRLLRQPSVHRVPTQPSRRTASKPIDWTL